MFTKSGRYNHQTRSYGCMTFAGNNILLLFSYCNYNAIPRLSRNCNLQPLASYKVLLSVFHLKNHLLLCYTQERYNSWHRIFIGFPSPAYNYIIIRFIIRISSCSMKKKRYSHSFQLVNVFIALNVITVIMYIHNGLTKRIKWNMHICQINLINPIYICMQIKSN